ncbi:hypothetical protein SEA_VANLEE_63 [Gordonia phage VanLee]|uniref:Uncharacterized protein n=1 Tax=Gordonia phage VanLee TaxID=2845816 RepID=A0A8F2DA48_9CAUD|nr:hypothetical protein QEH49_gp063 [Gordonia phage VanLee]QWS68180.1 hypothetical protein SEA_VANLEE_63 [Gordonia phage VanLee]
MPNFDPVTYPPALDNTSYRVVSAQSLSALDLSRIITFDVRLDSSPVHARLTGELREVAHDLRETTIWIGAHDRDDAGEKSEWRVDYTHEIAVWDER